MVTVKKKISETMLIGIFTITAYLLAYCYEAGICIYFNIPFYLIEVKLSNTLLIGAIIYCAGYFVAGSGTIFLHYLFAFFKLDDKLIKFYILFGLIGILIWVSICDILIRFLLIGWAIFFALVITLSLAYLIIFFSKKSFSSYKKKYDSIEEIPSPLTGFINLMISYNLNMTSTVLLFMSPFAFGYLGYYKSILQTTYLSTGHSIIVRKYENNYIAVTIDKKTHKLTDTLQIINESNISGNYLSETIVPVRKPDRILQIIADKLRE